MQEHALLGLALVIILGFGARWVAWALKLPSILLLLVAGLLVGPAVGWLNPDELFGQMLLPFVSLSVSLILFEGGLSLNLRELREIGAVVTRLITIGVAVTWALTAGTAHWLLGMEWPLALLMGGILVVTGPTVVIPLLRQVRPSNRIRNVVKWEGILNDPVGAILAVVIYEGIITQSFGGRAGLEEFGSAMLIGAGTGFLFAVLLILLLRFSLVPESLHNSFTLTLVFGAFVVSNHYASESGLVATTVMGLVAANQRFQDVREIVEFSENLRVLIISTLFILLAARLDMAEFTSLGWSAVVFVLLLIVVIRPLAVLASTWGSSLPRSERAYLAMLAPRGIVALAVASVFTEGLTEAGIGTAARIGPLTFTVVGATVLVYGLGARPLARWLGLSQPHPQGVLFVGAHKWACDIAAALHQLGLPVALADSDWGNVSNARMRGLPASFGSILSEHVLDDLDLYGIGNLFALTSNAEVNALAALHFSETFGRDNVYEAAPADEGRGGARRFGVATRFRGSSLFSPDANWTALDMLFARGATVKSTRLTEEFDYAAFQTRYGREALLLFAVYVNGEDRRLRVNTVEKPIKPKPGERIVAIIPAGAE